MKIGKSLHITWKDLACKDGSPYPIQFILDGTMTELVVMFEKIRAIWGLPIIINSAYRTVTYNKTVGGAKNSQHLLGRALDLQPPKGVSVESFHSHIRVRAIELGVWGLGKYPTFVHVDIRPSDRLVIW
jgi:uncharacterized protein YcbK (DUF882 family)